MRYPQINEPLRATVGLEKLYDYEFVLDLRGSNGQTLAGCAPLGGTIQLTDQLRGRRPVATYLHEVGHLIAYEYELHDTPHGEYHNKYFGVLVAVMYRRAKMLPLLKVYDFADVAGGDSFDMPSEAEIVERFAYIIAKSAELATSSLTIEQIAKHLYQTDLAAEYRNSGKQPFCVRSEWIAGVFGTALGIAISASAAAALYLVKYQNPF